MFTTKKHADFIRCSWAENATQIAYEYKNAGGNGPRIFADSMEWFWSLVQKDKNLPNMVQIAEAMPGEKVVAKPRKSGALLLFVVMEWNILWSVSDNRSLLLKHFFNSASFFVVKSVYPKMSLKHKVYFKLENTENGMDLIYTGQEENKLFRWIADINENESLVRVLPTNVVYIRNIKLGSLTPFVTEHNSVYVYNEKTCRFHQM